MKIYINKISKLVINFKETNNKAKKRAGNNNNTIIKLK